MKEQKTPWSIKILYWLSIFSFWMITFFSILILIANLILFTDLFTESIQLRISMPVPIEVVENGVLHLEDSDLNVRIEEAYGNLYFVDAPMHITKMVVRLMFIVVLISWFISWKFKKFMTNIKKGLVFEIDNINNLKHISYALVGLYGLSRVYMIVLKSYVIKQLEFSSIKIGGDTFDTDSIIILALVLWALAHVFVKGIEMKQEQELTI